MQGCTQIEDQHNSFKSREGGGGKRRENERCTHPVLRAHIKVPQHLLARGQPLAMLLVHRLRRAAVRDGAPVPLDGLVRDLGRRRRGVVCLGLGSVVVGLAIVGGGDGDRRLGLGRRGGGLRRRLGDVFFGAGGRFVAFFARLDGLGHLVLEAEGRLLAGGGGAGGRPGGAAGGRHCWW